MLGRASIPLVGVVDTIVTGRTGNVEALAWVALKRDGDQPRVLELRLPSHEGDRPHCLLEGGKDRPKSGALLLGTALPPASHRDRSAGAAISLTVPRSLRCSPAVKM